MSDQHGEMKAQGRLVDVNLTIRPATEADEGAIYSICRLTGNAGSDATGLVRHPELLGDIFAVPYLRLAPEFCFVAEDAGGVCAYILGSPDTSAFNVRFANECLPSMRVKYPLKKGDNSWDEMYVQNFIHQEPGPLAEALSAYPAHLHVDILPRAQGRGLGRKLMDRLLSEFKAQGVRGVHLGVDVRNAGAIAFYQRIGMTVLLHQKWGTVFGLCLEEQTLL